MSYHNPHNEQAIEHSTDVAEFLRILVEPNSVFEIRSIKCPERKGGNYVSTQSGYFNDCQSAAKAILSLDTLLPPAIYVTLNPVDSSLLARAVNRVRAKADKTTTKSDVLKRRWLFIDIDPIRAAGVSSTDAELDEANKLSNAIHKSLYAEGWPEPLQGMSGNGRYLLYRIYLPNDELSEQLTKDLLRYLAFRFNTAGAEVDTSTFDVNRICKVLGTVARKGDAVVGVKGISDRPHRQSWFIPPNTELQIVAPELLEALAASAPPLESTKRNTQHSEAKQRTTERASKSILDRARKYLATIDPAIEGQKGHSSIFKAACALVLGFDLSCEDALQLLRDEYNPRCVPPFSEEELRHKVESANLSNKERGYLLNGPDAQTEFAASDAPWDKPTPLDRVSVPAFPVDILPEPLQSWVSATAEATQTPPDLAALLSLAVCSGCVARNIEVIAGRGWREPVNLYVAVLLEPANRKSAVFSAAMRPLRAIERELIDHAGPDIAKLMSDRRCKEAKLKASEKMYAAKGKAEDRDNAQTLAEELATEPIPAMPKLYVDDSSAEAIENHLAAQGGRLIVAGCEGGLFDVMAGRYTNGAGNLDAFLKGHAGDDLRVDRVTRGSIVVENCSLTLAYAVQPEVIRGLAELPSFRGRGLIGRFMYSVPMSLLGNRRINPEPVSDNVASQYDALMRRLYALRGGDDGPALLSLSPDASSQFHTWQREVETMLADGQQLEPMRDWGGKLCGLTARLAAIIHLITQSDFESWREPIKLVSIQAAIAIARWAIPHAEAMLDLMSGGNEASEDATYLLRWIEQNRLREFSQRDAHVHGRSRFDAKPERLQAAFELLTECNVVRPMEPEPSKKPGRPPSPRFAVNPDVTGDAPKSPERESGVV